MSEAAVRADPVRAGLRGNTEEAAERGVFGVATLVMDGQVFWGTDAVPFARAYLNDPAVLDDLEMRRRDELPVGASR